MGLMIWLVVIWWLGWAGAVSAQITPTPPPTGWDGVTGVTRHGVILERGLTYEDIWREEANHPPTDGTIDTWNYYGNGDQLVTRGDEAWFKAQGTLTWTQQSLRQRWSDCSMFPSDGVDALAIHPVTGEITAMKGYWSYRINAQGVCQANGRDKRVDWQETDSPSGKQPLQGRDHIDQMQWTQDDVILIVTDDQLWFFGAVSVNNVNSPCWEKPMVDNIFCEPETLTERWVDHSRGGNGLENIPALSGIDIFSVVRQPQMSAYQMWNVGRHIWTFGQYDEYRLFLSGPDGLNTRDAFLLADGGQYYLYYDGVRGNSHWITNVAVADHPLGPWTKRGEVVMTGEVRPWELHGSNGSTIFKVGEHYYDFYLGASAHLGGGEFWGRPGFSGYYKMGLAMADNPLGPFRRLKGDGSSANATATDPPLLITGGTVNSGAPMGTLLQKDADLYYVYTTQATTEPKWGMAVAKARNGNLLGPYEALGPSQTHQMLIPFSEDAENAGIYYDTASGLYLMFTNVMSHPDSPWSWLMASCPTNIIGHAGVALYWSRDLFNWPYVTDKRLLAYRRAGIGCDGGMEGDYFLLPGKEVAHQGHIGLGSPVYVPEEDKVYVVYDGNDFMDDGLEEPRNTAYRNLFMLSLDMGVVRPLMAPEPGDVTGDGVLDIRDVWRVVEGFGEEDQGADINGSGLVDVFDFNAVVQALY
ncbi:hypothetical protein A2W24_04120 [Microgenomates group bacterium RBG_16_45_19]|nr:MAG: hypothetical protein A2W24_04120 [Microgenomates group bacterium RBG_16_45_19]